MNWSGLPAAFGLIFLAELGDKTQLAVVAQTCKYNGRPWAVFLGASLALTAVTALGAVAGQLLGSVIPLSIIRWVAAAAFVVMGLLIALQAARSRDRGTAGETCDDSPIEDIACEPSGAQLWAPFASTLGLLFVAELGDKTQLAVFTLASQGAEGVPVFLGGSLALVVVTAIGVLGGQALSRFIPRRTLLWLSALAFVLIGLLMAFGVL